MNAAAVELRRFDNPIEFASLTNAFLLEREAENCFFLGHLPTLSNPTDVLLLAVMEADAVAGVALMTPGWHMVATRSPAHAAVALARYLHAQEISLPGIQAPRDVVEPFAQEWKTLTGTMAQPAASMAVHQASRIIPPARPAPGRMRTAHCGDIDMLAEWVADFGRSIGEAHFTNGRPIAERRVAAGEVVLWEDGGRPVAMAGSAGATPNGIRVNLVYTPPRFRNRGYASTLVAALSQDLLESGRRFCFLYTDLANPTSNKIYRAIGYEPVGESLRVEFDQPSDAR